MSSCSSLPLLPTADFQVFHRIVLYMTSPPKTTTGLNWNKMAASAVPLRKERTHEAVKILGRADRLCVSSPVNETLAMESFQRSAGPDTWLVVSQLRHHGAALRYRSVTTQH